MSDVNLDELLTKTDLSHAVEAIIGVNLAEMGNIDWEVDITHGAITIRNAQGEQVIVRIMQVE